METVSILWNAKPLVFQTMETCFGNRVPYNGRGFRGWEAVLGRGLAERNCKRGGRACYALRTMNTTPISSAKQAADAADFAAFWRGKGYEKGQTQPFWLDLLRVLGVEKPSAFIEFEDAAHLDETHGFIDGYIPATHVLVEQKSLGKDLRAPIRQSDGTLLTPFQQARRYAATLPYSRRPRWIVTCNFAEFLVYDMENPNAEPESIRLADLENELYRLHFLVNVASDRVAREMEVSIEAGRIVGRIYDALLAQYGNPTPEVLHWLNVLCVRLVFCLYAEDAGIFADDQFHDWLATIPTHRLRQALLDLFAVLDTPKEARSRYLDPALAAFPYVNGSLFSGVSEIPQFTEDLRTALLEKASLGFDWSEISPTIFGAVFESTLNPDTRRSGGMHYTSIENIHKVIDPLFLDGLRAELDGILEATATGTTGTAGTKGTGTVAREAQARLRAFQDKLAGLSFLDPACGSGNFLTETYLSLRKLENEAIAALIGPQSLLDLEGNPVAVKVKISQFHGIEINDFAVSVAKTALWIAESQMLAQTAKLLHRNLDFLPLKTAADIREGNALRMDWEECLNSRGDAEARRKFDYIIGNPPFRGARRQSPEQKADLVAVFGSDWKGLGELDYVSGWYKKAADLMAAQPETRAAFVSVNSITQGEQVAPLWKPLVADGLSIDFAHRSFVWDSESTEKAHVHCVIVGFSARNPRNSSDSSLPLFDGPRKTLVPHINPYLVPADDIFVESCNRSLAGMPAIGMGNQPIDAGNYLFTPDEKAAFLALEPAAEPFFRPWYGAEEFIHRSPRWCLWLGDCEPHVLRSMPHCLKRIEAVRNYRLASTRASTRRLAERPTHFQTGNMPKSNYIVIPEVSSERRRYIPIGYLTPDVLCSNKLRLMPDATLWHFGILTSNVHMAWMRAVCGRMKSDYSYSINIVYNTFPWPDLRASASPREKISSTARAILDARAAHPDSTLADLYDPLTMPPDLLAAHRANDRAVMSAYGFDAKMTESDCVAALFRLYEGLAGKTVS